MDKTVERTLALLFTLFAVCLALYSIWSYSLTDPNLVLTSWSPYWNSQQWLWQNIFAQNQLLSTLYVGLLLLLWAVYGAIGWVLHRSSRKMRSKDWLLVALALSPALLSYNALSHDVFNYIFNARMVVEYGADPHVQTALQFASDSWVRFMHNVHTPAPYGYGWTVVSIVPYLLGMGKFTLTWFWFKLAAAASVGLLAYVLSWFASEVRKSPLNQFEVVMVFLNPLLVIEVLGNAHNDLWMIVPAMSALGLALHSGSRKVIWIFLLLLYSVMIKFATVVLLPVFVTVLYAENIWERLRSRLVLRLPLRLVVPVAERFFGGIVRKNVVGVVTGVSALLLLIPLLTDRSQQFHPWYLLWSLAWLPLVTSRFVQILILSLSISSLFRYVPWLLAGGFTPEVLFQQKLITWVGGLTVALIWIAWDSYRRRSTRTILPT